MQEPTFFTTENIHGPGCIESRKPFFLDYRVVPPFCPSAKMRDSGLVEGMDVGPLPPLHWLRQNRFKTSSSSLGREWYRVTNKPFPTSAVSNWPQSSKEQRIHTNRWEGGLLGATPLYSLSQELGGPQRPVSFS